MVYVFLWVKNPILTIYVRRYVHINNQCMQIELVLLVYVYVSGSIYVVGSYDQN